MIGDATKCTKNPIRQIQTLFALGSLGALDDAQLLELFLEKNGQDAEDAFAEIVRRHGPLVLGACRRMLDNSHDTDDAFQATFLILSRKAWVIGSKQQLASWLHGVAVRAAREIRRADARRRKRESQVMDTPRAESAPQDDHTEMIPLLDEELARLPERLLCQ